MEIRYEREANYACMVLEAQPKVGFERRMVLENRIDGFVPVSLRLVDDREELCYGITGLMSLKEFLEHSSLRCAVLKQFIFTLCCLADRLEDYLLSADCLVLEPETIFLRRETVSENAFIVKQEEAEWIFSLCVCPHAEQNLKDSLCKVVRYLMEKADPLDEACASLCYSLYEVLQKENFCLSEFMTILEAAKEAKKAAGRTGKETAQKEKRRGLPTNRILADESIGSSRILPHRRLRQKTEKLFTGRKRM